MVVFFRGEEVPSHVISAILISHDHSLIVTGSVNGQLCVWEVEAESYKVLKLEFFKLKVYLLSHLKKD